jgi:hypothetical protein
MKRTFSCTLTLQVYDVGKQPSVPLHAIVKRQDLMPSYGEAGVITSPQVSPDVGIPIEPPNAVSGCKVILTSVFLPTSYLRFG